MRGLVALVAHVVLAGCVLAGCARWTRANSALEAAFFATAAIDWTQTEIITDDCRELNPVIGHCGEWVQPEVYFPVVLAVHLAIAAVLPRVWREVFQSFTVGLEASTIYRNKH